jgi:hypothetical protein
MSSGAPHPPLDVRPPFGLRIPLLAFAAGLCGVGLFGVVYSLATSTYPGLGTAAIFIAIGWLCWRAASARFTVSDDRVIVARNYFRTWRMSIKDVEQFEPGDPYGIRASLRSGKRIQINAVQKSNWATWTGKRTRADVIVDQLNEMIDQSP